MISSLVRTRTRAVALSAVPVVALLVTAAFAPLPFVVAQPGTTADVLGERNGEPVISIEGAPVRKTSGELRMTTILATGPSTDIGVGDLVDSWFRTDRTVLPKEAVYPSGKSDKQIEKINQKAMEESQNDAAEAALGYLGEDPAKVKVSLELEDIGGPSAGLLFSLGIVDKLDGDGAGGDLTGGRTIAGTGTIDPDGKVGPVGGVSLKTQAAKRDGATVFLVPEDECSDAVAERPEGLRLVPVASLKGAVDALRALAKGERVPAC